MTQCIWKDLYKWTVTNVKIKITDNISKIKQQIEKGTYNGLWAVGATIHRDAVENVPVDTGRLRASLGWDVEGNRGGGLEDSVHTSEKSSVVVGTNVEYAEKIENYKPYLRPALDRTKPKLQRIFEKYIKEALK